MLARLQNSLGRDDLIEQMVLLPEPKKSFSPGSAGLGSVNLIVGYSASPKSHTALDIAFWIAHQTRLATNAVVKVHAVYVEVNKSQNQYLHVFDFEHNQQQRSPHPLSYHISQPMTSTLRENSAYTATKQGDKILEQARNLAEEWESSFESHLCFGRIGSELRKIVELSAAGILFLGCRSVHHPLIQTLGDRFPCAVLGIPHCIDD